MTRGAASALIVPLLLVALLASIAFAASAPDPDIAENEPGYVSAARGGTFTELPPSGNGFPPELLAAMRRKLGGARPVPEAPHAPPAGGVDGE